MKGKEKWRTTWLEIESPKLVWKRNWKIGVQLKPKLGEFKENESRLFCLVTYAAADFASVLVHAPWCMSKHRQLALAFKYTLAIRYSFIICVAGSLDCLHWHTVGPSHTDALFFLFSFLQKLILKSDLEIAHAQYVLVCIPFFPYFAHCCFTCKNRRGRDRASPVFLPSCFSSGSASSN